MMTGTGMTTKNGDTPSPFGSVFQIQELEDMKNRFKLVFVAFIIGALYSSLLLLVLEFTLADILIMLGTLFLGYRSVKLSDEISEIKQYLHGEGVLALE